MGVYLHVYKCIGYAYNQDIPSDPLVTQFSVSASHFSFIILIFLFQTQLALYMASYI